MNTMNYYTNKQIRFDDEEEKRHWWENDLLDDQLVKDEVKWNQF